MSKWAGRKPTSEELADVLAQHTKWLRGYGGARSDLSWINLSGADLTRADLSGADLSWANLTGANLSGANLTRADLFRADLSRSDLSWINLSGADLFRADLSGADLSGANLSGANLLRADLYGAKDAELTIARTRILPDGEIVGWKQCLDGVIVRLSIPADARRSHAFGRKCRAERAVVLEVIGGSEGVSLYTNDFVYRVGETVKPDAWDENWQNECGGGIHFYLTRLEAEAHE